MNLSRFFVDRPIFAAVLSILIFTAGMVAIPLLPISEYPEVVPTTVVVKTVYPGANPKVLAETVAAPLEQAINGAEHMIYMKSVASSDGTLTLTVTFQLGTDPDAAQVQVQNRVSQVLNRLPEDVRRQGVTTQKQSANVVLFVHLLSPDNRYDVVYLRNYAELHVVDELRRIPGLGDALALGGGQYAMRVWLDPAKVAARNLTAGDVVAAIREQNVQVSAGQLGAPPTPQPAEFLLSINANGRLVTEDEFRQIVVRTGANGEVTRLGDVARLELGANSYGLRALLDNQQAVGIAILQAPGSNALELSQHIRARMDELSKSFPEGMKWDVAYDPTAFVSASIHSVVETLFEAALLVVLVVIVFLQTWRASVIRITPDAGQAVPSFLQNLQFISRELDADRPGSQIVRTRMADVIFVQVLRAYIESLPGGSAGFLGALREKNMAAALGLMHQRPEVPWTVAKIADEVGLSRSGFAARFAELVGEPPLGYLTRLRMQRASMLLQEGATLSKASQMTGYASEASFSYAFRQWAGIAPGAYRRRLRSAAAE